MLSVYFVDDDELIIEELIHIINWNEYGFKVCGYSTDSIFAKKEILELNPTLVISDVQMDGLSGLELAEEVGKINNKINFCFLSVFDKFDYAIEAIRLGAIRYLKKPIRVNELSNLLRETKNKVLENFSFKLSTILLNDGSNQQLALKKLFENSPLFDNERNFRIAVLYGENKGKLDLSNCCSSYETLYKDDVMEINIMFDLNLNELKLVSEIHNIAIGVSKENNEYNQISKRIKEARIASKQEFISGKKEMVVFKENIHIENLIKEIENTKNAYELKHIINHLKEKIEEINLTANYIQKIYTVISYNLIRHNVMEYNEEIINLSALYFYNSLDEMIENLLDNFEQITVDDYNLSLLSEIKKDLEENISKKISLSEYAKKYGYNTSYFSQLFKKISGITFAEYLISLKIEKAKELIVSNTRLSLRSIASIVGYDDYYHFSKMFKKYTNYTPTEFKEMSQKE